jgi:hypothetical protein
LNFQEFLMMKNSSSQKSDSGARKGRTKELPAVLATAVESEALLDIGEPMGACFWIDNIGQNHCTVTTQSQCSKLPKGKFFPDKRCPGGS